MQNLYMYILIGVLISLLIVSSVLFYKNEPYYPYYDPLLNTAFNDSSPNWDWEKVKTNEDNLCRPCGKYYTH